MSEIQAARTELRDVVEELGGIERRLRGVAASLSGKGEPEAGNAAEEVRSVIECVLLDSIGPAIRDLRAASEPSDATQR
jgi:hypothetical protein